MADQNDRLPPVARDPSLPMVVLDKNRSTDFWLTMRVAPPPVFSEVFILKGFKSCVLEVRILKGLGACFSEVRILKDLAIGDA